MRPARFFAILSACYLSFIAIYYVEQRDYLFFTSRIRISPQALDLQNVAEMELPTPDGQRLIAWYAPPASGEPTLFYLHGNAGALVHRASRVRLYRAQGYGVFMLAYRGYSGSTGRPTETNIVADALMAYDTLDAFTPRDSKIIVYGESLGTGVAVQVAAKRRPDGMVLESPFSSAADVAAHLYPFLPVYWLLKDRFESISYIGDVKAPLLVLQGGRDTIVPPKLGRKLLAAARGPKLTYLIEDATHYTLYEHGAFDRVKTFLDSFAIGRAHPGTISASCGAACRPAAD
jgi:fermentation-respiration switch protein FrsA (DUF1100 family)